MSSKTDQSLNYPFLLLTHLVCADREIHNKELNHLHILAGKKGINNETLREKEKILTQDESLLSMETVAEKISPQQQNATMGDLLLMAFADGYFSPLERQMLEQVREIWNWSSEKLENFIQSANEFQEAQENYFTTLHQKTKLEGRLWNDPDYEKGIQDSAIVSHEDYPFAKEALEKTEAKLKELEQKLDDTLTDIQNQINQKAKAETAKEVINLLHETIQHLKEEIQTKLIAVQDSLEAKKSSLDYFTIAFMGKTKAGKSTLHSILTEQGWDAIGAGKQRTTRLNRVYEWKNIRIIDTPGIGAPGGKTDEEIAQSIINKADLVVFVVTNDSQQESEFQFLKLLKENAKPLCILLNVFKNLSNSRRGEYELKRFLENPERLFNDQEMKGHFNRIRGYAEKYYGNDYFAIVPVMLLAAQLSYQDKHENHKEQLWEASQIEKFLDQIRLSVVEQGTIRRSQNLLGSTVKVIEEANNWAKEQATPYHALAEEIQQKQEKLEQDIDKAIKETDEALEIEMKALFQKIRDAIPQFAEEHWNESESKQKLAWEKLLKEIKLEERLKNSAEEKWNDFINKVKQLLEELGKDLQFTAEFGGIPGFDFDDQDTFDWKKFFNIVGGLLGVGGAFAFLFAGGFIPGIVMTVTGIVMGLVANLFKSKAEIKKEAVEKISKSLLQQIDKDEKKQTNQVTADFQKNCNQVKTEVKTYFHQLVAGLETISRQLNTSQSNLDQQVNFLNCAYGKRIIDWSQKHYEPLNQDAINREVVSVTRDISKSITIEAKKNVSITRTQEELDSILQEKVEILVNGQPITPPIKQEIVKSVTEEKPQLSIEELVKVSLTKIIPKLDKLLQQEKWKEGEKVTFEFLLKLIEFPESQTLKEENITEADFQFIEETQENWQEFNFSILQKIDQIWRNYSKEKYGLTLQQEMYQDATENYFASWYKVGVDRQQNDYLFFPLYSRFYLVKPKVKSESDFQQKLEELKENWKYLQQKHNEIMSNLKPLQQEILRSIEEGNKSLAKSQSLTQDHYWESAKNYQSKLEELMIMIDQTFSN